MAKNKKKVVTMILALAVAVSTIFSTLPTIVKANPKVANQGQVAKIGDVYYSSLDEAIASATDNAIIEVLQDCETNGINLTKNLTIRGAAGIKPTINFVKDGIAIWGKTLAFDNCNIKMLDVGGTPYAEWKWMTICASVNSSLNLNEVDMLLDGQNIYDQNKHAIYFTGNNSLSMNRSTLTIKNYKQDALEWDGGDGGYNCNFRNSTFISDHNRSGFTGTFYATFDNSNVKVINSTGNGSNGTYFKVQNNSDVLFQNNRNWGMSGYFIDVTTNSTVRALDNGFSGMWVRALNVDGTSTLDIQRNGNHSWGSKTNAGLFFQGNGKKKSVIEDGATVIIKDNAGSGIYTKQSACDMTINTDAIITNNGLGTVDTYNHYGAKYGGGIYNVGTMVLSDKVVIYNNHADLAGDDIYSTKDITFPKVSSKWSLDGTPDCNGELHAIDGWYDDSENTRWQAHEKETTHLVMKDAGHYADTVAFKAAHGRHTVTIHYLEANTKEELKPIYTSETFRVNTPYNVGDQYLESIETENGIYKLVAHEGDSKVGIFDADKDIKLYYKRVNKVNYEFISGTEGMDLPESVMNLLPVDETEYLSGSNVTAIQPTTLKVEVEGGIWEFVSYDQNEILGIQKDEKFVGTWVYSKTHKVTYEFVSGTEGKELPKEVLDLLPVDSNNYKQGSDVKAMMPSSLEVKVNDGIWKFKQYDKNEVLNIQADEKFVGTWVFEKASTTTPSTNDSMNPTIYGSIAIVSGALLLALKKRKMLMK